MRLGLIGDDHAPGKSKQGERIMAEASHELAIVRWGKCEVATTQNKQQKRIVA